MNNRIGDICTLNTPPRIGFDDWISLCEKIVSIADFFGFRSLPDEFKIKIHVCSEEELEMKKDKLYVDEFDSAIAFVCNANEIFVLDYVHVSKNQSVDEYNAVVVHECTHIFQAYFSMMPPGKYVWLYEAVACYLAKQKSLYKTSGKISWELFMSDFYKIKNCYALAYVFGEVMFRCFGDEILMAIKEPEKNIDRFKELYVLEFLK